MCITLYKENKMDAFFRTHTYLVEHVNAPVRRRLMDEIDWNDRRKSIMALLIANVFM